MPGTAASRSRCTAWIYSVADGLLRDLEFGATGAQDSTMLLEQAVLRLPPDTPVG